ncbi:hypothetical protein EKO04_001801 [Ascochyta lentis]|uniref:Uncharacterized protein n=1 Tax=Ascochyta lentis TaxID=205686 RepID=A0A8H7JCW2_9PLEO|nr:hypothetical protein EKO04_001801 [Ascochyta lentis]
MTASNNSARKTAQLQPEEDDTAADTTTQHYLHPLNPRSKNLTQLHHRHHHNELNSPLSSASETLHPSSPTSSSTFEDLYNESLQQTTDLCSSSPPSPCAEAWMKIASLLQLRNSYLEYQVRKLREENGSLEGDVAWHVEALGRVEGELSEVRELVGSCGGGEVVEVGEVCSGTNLTDSGLTTLVLGCGESGGVQLPTTTCTCTTHTTSHHPPPSFGFGFHFHPASSTISIDNHTIKWPPTTTLPQIRYHLISRHEQGIRDPPHLAAILQIMHQREVAGVALPRSTPGDAVVWIGVPDVRGFPFSRGDGGVVEAWESCGHGWGEDGGAGECWFGGGAWGGEVVSFVLPCGG